MNKISFLRLGFSGLCRAVGYGILLIVAYMLTTSIAKQVSVSTCVFMCVIGLLASAILLYLGNIPIYGSTAEELRTNTSIAPHMNKTRVFVIVNVVLVFAFIIVKLMYAPIISDEEKVKAKEYLLNSEMSLEDTDLLETLPPVFTDKLFISANYIEAAYAYADNIESADLKKSFDEATVAYDNLTGACRVRTVLLCLLIYSVGVLSAILRLRIDYVMRLKEVNKYESN